MGESDRARFQAVGNPVDMPHDLLHVVAVVTPVLQTRRPSVSDAHRCHQHMASTTPADIMACPAGTFATLPIAPPRDASANIEFNVDHRAPAWLSIHALAGRYHAYVSYVLPCWLPCATLTSRTNALFTSWMVRDAGSDNQPTLYLDYGLQQYNSSDRQRH